MPRITAPTHDATMMMMTTDAAATNHHVLETAESKPDQWVSNIDQVGSGYNCPVGQTRRLVRFSSPERAHLP